MNASRKPAGVRTGAPHWGIILLTIASGLATPAASLYVWQQSPTPAAPFATWESAAHTIQDAVDAAAPDDEIVVTNGVYATGGRAVFGTMTNRVAVTKAVHVRSVNGAQFTAIVGRQVPGSRIGARAVRCVYLAEGAVLSGFTLTNGATSGTGIDVPERSGGGVLCASTNALVSHCTLVSNAASFGGGGAYSGTLSNCTLTGNESFNGGGAYESRLMNCVLTGNTAYQEGGGADRARLFNCTVTGNSAVQGGGVAGCGLDNCIVYYNSAPTSAKANHADGATSFEALDYCCTTPLPSRGRLNFTNAPLFVDLVGSDLRLQPGSPCIGAGHSPSAVGDADFDGLPRVAGLRVDVGAYEFQGPGLSLYATWLQQHGLPVDGSADFTDNDSDQANNWQEWMADTNPADTSSVLRVSQSAPGTLRFITSPNRQYTVQFAGEHFGVYGYAMQWADLPGFTNVLGNGGWLELTDPTPAGARFYRVNVQWPPQ